MATVSFKEIKWKRRKISLKESFGTTKVRFLKCNDWKTKSIGQQNRVGLDWSKILVSLKLVDCKCSFVISPHPIKLSTRVIVIQELSTLWRSKQMFSHWPQGHSTTTFWELMRSIVANYSATTNCCQWTQVRHILLSLCTVRIFA